jgi:Leucine-rich repeat (LRR) protein
VSTLPREIGQLLQLRELDLSYNSLKEIPPEFGHLTNLKSLNIENNQLTILPKSVCQLLKNDTITVKLAGNKFEWPFPVPYDANLEVFYDFLIYRDELGTSLEYSIILTPCYRTKISAGVTIGSTIYWNNR